MKRITSILLLVVPCLIGAGAWAQPPDQGPAESALAKKARDEGVSRELVDKLTQDQLVQVLRQQEETKVALAPFTHGHNPEEVVVPIAFFAVVIVLVALPLYFRHRKEREQQITVRQMIERGVTIPVELLAPPPRPRSDLRRGVLLVAAGLGLATFLKAVHAPPGGWTLGLIPLLIGAGYLVVWRITRTQEPTQSPGS